MAQLMAQGKQQYFDDNGGPLSGGKLWTYAAGTTTPLATYSDAAGTTPNTNPVVLNARGEATIFWSSAPYKVVLTDASDVTIWTQDNISTPLADLSGASGSALVGFSQSVSYASGTVGAALKRVVSVTDEPFGAIGDGVTDDTAAVQAALASGAAVFFPHGTYALSAALALTTPWQRLYGDGALSVLRQDGDGVSVFSASSVDNVSISDLCIRPAATHTTTAGHGVLFSNCNSASVRGVLVEYQAGEARNGVFLANCNECDIRGNHFSGAPDTNGVYFIHGGADIAVTENSSRNTISANRCVSGNVYGINLTTSSAGECQANVITGNVVANCTGYGIIAYRANDSATFRDLVISDNTIENITGGALSDGEPPSTVRKFGSGIYVQGCIDAVVSGNVVRNTAQQTNNSTLAIGGISGTVTSCAVSGNSVIDSGTQGIFFSGLPAAASFPDPADSGIVINDNVVKDSVKELIYINQARRISIAGNVLYRGASADGSTSIRIGGNGTDWVADASVTGNVIYGDDGLTRGVGVSVEACRHLIVDANSISEVTSGISVDTTTSLLCCSNVVRDASAFGITYSASTLRGVVANNQVDAATTAGIRANGVAKVTGNDITNTTTSYSGTYAPIRSLADGATPDVTNAELLFSGGTTAITSFSGGYVGQIFTFIAGHSITITHNAAAITLSGNANFAMTAGDTLTLVKATATVWNEIGRMDR